MNPWNKSRGAGNVRATYPIYTTARTHIHVTSTFVKGHLKLLIWVDQSSGYVITKSSASRTAHTIVESLRGICVDGLSQLKPSNTIGSQGSCLRLIRFIGSWARLNASHWRTDERHNSRPNTWSKNIKGRSRYVYHFKNQSEWRQICQAIYYSISTAHTTVSLWISSS